MTVDPRSARIIYGLAILICFMPFVSPAIALALGLVLSLTGVKSNLSEYSSFLLKASIVLLGFGMNLTQVISSSKTGFIDTALTVAFVMICGLLLGKALKVDSKIALLLSSGTAICGGSAIAAIAPVINAKSYQISFSMVIIFILNAIALVIFPFLGHAIGLSQEVFGYWAAIAIHDTSSVVGAGATYGAKALEIATTVKLIRALWIIPLALVIALFQKDKSTGKVNIPWFIGLFVASIGVVYLLPGHENVFSILQWLGTRGMIVALFLIGSSISISEAKKAGGKSFVLGISLWLIIATVSYFSLTYTLR